MRSIRTTLWQKIERTAIPHRRQAPRHSMATKRDAQLADAAPGPDRAVMAERELVGVRRLFAQDATALSILDGLAQGLTAEKIRVSLRLSATEYASARKRMRRVWLKEGLTCARK